MAQIIISEDAYQALVTAITERGVSPEDVITAGLQALDEHDQQWLPKPLTADEFEKQVLGMTTEDRVDADAEAHRLYPEAYP